MKNILLLVLVLLQGVTSAFAGSVTFHVVNNGVTTQTGTVLYWNTVNNSGAASYLNNFGTLNSGGGSSDFTTGFSDYTLYLWYVSSQTGTRTPVNEFPVNTGSAGSTVNVTIYGGGAPPTPKCWSVKLTNTGNSPGYYVYSVDSATAPAASGWNQLASGGNATFSWSDSQGGSNHVLRIWKYKNVDTDYPVAENIYTSTSGTDSATNCSPANVNLNDNGLGVSQYNTDKPGVDGTNAPPVDWNGTGTNGGLALELTLRRTAEIIYTGLKDVTAGVKNSVNAAKASADSAAATAHSDASSIATKLDTLHSDNTAQNVYFDGIRYNITNAASSSASQLTNDLAIKGILGGVWLNTSNAVDRLNLVRAGTDYLPTMSSDLIAIKNNTTGANSLLSGISSYLEYIRNASGNIESYAQSTKNNTEGVFTNSIDQKNTAKSMYATLTNILAALSQTNLLTSAMLSNLANMNLTITNGIDGVANKIDIDTRTLTNGINSLSNIAYAGNTLLQGVTNMSRDREITNMLSQIISNTSGGSISNTVNVTVTNQFTITNNIALSVTNDPLNTNVVYYGAANAQTNYSAAKTMAQAAMPNATYGGFSADLNGYSQTVPAGTEPDMTLSWGSGMFAWSGDFNPVHRFPQFFDMSRNFWTFMLTVGFLTALWRFTMQALQMFSGVQSGGAPNMEASAAGFGGNAIGVAMGFASSIAIVALWALVFVALGVYIASAVSDLIGREQIFGSAGAGGMWLLNQSFPTSLFFGYTMSLLVIRFAGAQILMISIAATRFIMNR